MVVNAHPDSPLRLPSSVPAHGVNLPAGDPRSRLGELGLRRFTGRVELRAADWLVELLLREGEPLAAALGGPGLDKPLEGQEALKALLDQALVPWSCRLEPLQEPLSEALGSLGARPEQRPLEGPGGVRTLLRELAGDGQAGVLELSAGRQWARVLLAKGRLLGSYSSLAPELAASLAPVAELLSGNPPTAAWYAAQTAIPMQLPAGPAGVEAESGEPERQLIWVVSRFEGTWGRARERGDGPFGLQEALAQMVEALRVLAGELEHSTDDSAALAAAMAELVADGRPTPVLTDLDYRLQGLGPSQACSMLAELAARELDRIAQVSSEAGLAEFCRQAAGTLEGEVRAAFTPPVKTGGQA